MQCGIVAFSKTLQLKPILPLLGQLRIKKNCPQRNVCIQRLAAETGLAYSFSVPFCFYLFSECMRLCVRLCVFMYVCRCHRKLSPPWYCRDRSVETLSTHVSIAFQPHWIFLFQGEYTLLQSHCTLQFLHCRAISFVPVKCVWLLLKNLLLLY